MNAFSFNKIKELYVPVFSKTSLEEQVNEAKDTFKRLDFKATLRNQILNYISEYGSFNFSKQEFQSGDVIEFYSRPLKFCNPYLEEFGERVAFIGGFRNCSCSFCGRQETFLLQDALEQVDESFSQMLLRKIDEKNMTDAQCYKKAQIDRKLFSKIRSQQNYRPSKQTAISFALALELSLAEAKDLLLKAGFALSRSSKADIIVEFFILHGIYDIMQVNEALYEFDQPLL